MDMLLVVDMQVGLLSGASNHDLDGVVDRINSLVVMVRRRSGKVVWIQHCGGVGDDFEPNKPGWAFLPALDRLPTDMVIQKTLNDPYVGTELEETVDRIGPERLLIAGWATDFCVDTTVRSSVSRNYPVVAVSDGHTLSDRPHLDAPAVIRHHNWVWGNLLAKRSVRVAETAQLLDED